MKNYYLILEVDASATQDEIRSSYRRLAKSLHPDYYGRDSGPFIDLQEAYAVLSDPGRRRAYDRRARPSTGRGSAQRVWSEPLVPEGPAPEPLIPEWEPADLGDLSLSHSFRSARPSFEELLDRIWQNFSLFRPKVEHLKSLNVEIRVSPGEALRGGRVRLLVPARLKCPVCNGRGGIGLFDCFRCNGSGAVQGEYPVTVTYPQGIINNYVIQIPLDQFGIRNFYLNVIFKVSKM